MKVIRAHVPKFPVIADRIFWSARILITKKPTSFAPNWLGSCLSRAANRERPLWFTVVRKA